MHARTTILVTEIMYLVLPATGKKGYSVDNIVPRKDTLKS